MNAMRSWFLPVIHPPWLKPFNGCCLTNRWQCGLENRLGLTFSGIPGTLARRGSSIK
jgi:hypothetical protein